MKRIDQKYLSTLRDLVIAEGGKVIFVNFTKTLDDEG